MSGPDDSPRRRGPHDPAAFGGPPRWGRHWGHGGGPPWRRRHGPFRIFRPAEPWPPRRDLDERLLGGVAAGIARWQGWNPTTVRVAFALLAVVTSGTWAAVYVGAWLLMPARAEGRDEDSVWSKGKHDSLGITLAVGTGSALGILFFLITAINNGWILGWLWPQAASAAGLVLIWRNASPQEQAGLHRLVAPLSATAGLPGEQDDRRGSRAVLRIAIAAVLFIAGLGWLLSAKESLAMLRPLGGAVLMLAGLVLFLGPWWLKIARDLVIERQARARAEERTEIASRVHDSVLQTLALIQRRASDPQQVVQLARSQERELRSWLFEGRAPGDRDGVLFTDGLRDIQQELEARYGLPVEVVTVGDCELDENLNALLAAGREAVVNAAKWSGASVISLYGEVEPGRVTLVVRDRGKGFDTGSVPADRKGLAESVYGRMARRGGTASVTSAPGEGTKVSVSIPRNGAGS
jgi:signal transduction histidine kinase